MGLLRNRRFFFYTYFEGALMILCFMSYFWKKVVPILTLAGTRPPTVDEWDKYELHHRARLATKPGLTGMWQVSGRSNITDYFWPYCPQAGCCPDCHRTGGYFYTATLRSGEWAYKPLRTKWQLSSNTQPCTSCFNPPFPRGKGKRIKRSYMLGRWFTITWVLICWWPCKSLCILNE